jgi:RimJ/RimL family protein N-acetyltransferase
MADPAINIRPLQPDEAAAYRAIRLEGLQLHPEAFGASFESEAAQSLDWFAERLGDRAVYGAFRRGELVGVSGFYPQTTPKLRHKGVLWGMYVRPSSRGTGTAQALVERVIEHAQGRVELLHLTVVRTNDRARRLYTRAGFTEYGIEPRSLKVGETYHDEVLMVRDLTR